MLGESFKMAEGLAEETVSLATSMNEDGPLPVLVHPHEASKTEEGINTIFSSLNHHLESEQTLKEEIRNVTRDLDQLSRDMFTELQKMHQIESIKDDEICMHTKSTLEKVQVKLKDLGALIPTMAYYRYHDHWRFTLQKLCYSVVMMAFLETGRLPDRNEVASSLKIATVSSAGFHLDVEDYLHGVLTMASELSRLAVNSVIKGDYQRPFQIASFLSEINCGFRLLNLKNDSLRKRYDVLKYDVKKVEEIVYDISIRGLKPTLSNEK